MYICTSSLAPAGQCQPCHEATRTPGQCCNSCLSLQYVYYIISYSYSIYFVLFLHSYLLHIYSPLSRKAYIDKGLPVERALNQPQVNYHQSINQLIALTNKYILIYYPFLSIVFKGGRMFGFRIPWCQSCKYFILPPDQSTNQSTILRMADYRCYHLSYCPIYLFRYLVISILLWEKAT